MSRMKAAAFFEVREVNPGSVHRAVEVHVDHLSKTQEAGFSRMTMRVMVRSTTRGASRFAGYGQGIAGDNQSIVQQMVVVQ